MSVRPSQKPLNSLKSSSFILHHSSFIILHSSFIILHHSSSFYLHFAIFKLFSLFFDGSPYKAVFLCFCRIHGKDDLIIAMKKPRYIDWDAMVPALWNWLWLCYSPGQEANDSKLFALIRVVEPQAMFGFYKANRMHVRCEHASLLDGCGGYIFWMSMDQ